MEGRFEEPAERAISSETRNCGTSSLQMAKYPSWFSNLCRECFHALLDYPLETVEAGAVAGSFQCADARRSVGRPCSSRGHSP
jgi:hypothetical protein